MQIQKKKIIVCVMSLMIKMITSLSYFKTAILLKLHSNFRITNNKFYAGKHDKRIKNVKMPLIVIKVLDARSNSLVASLI